MEDFSINWNRCAPGVTVAVLISLAHKLAHSTQNDMNGRALTLFWVLQLCLLAYAFAGSVQRQVRQVSSPVAFGLNGYCGGYNDVDCSAVCYWNGAKYYQCRPDKCYCF